MRQSILALFGVCLAAAMGELLLPREGGSARGMIRFLTGLIVLLLILTPFTGFLKNHASFFEGELSVEEGNTADFEQIFSDAIREQSGKDLTEGLYALLSAEYGIGREDCSILVFFETDGTLRRVAIFLSGKAMLQNPEELSDTLEERLNCTVEVR